MNLQEALAAASARMQADAALFKQDALPAADVANLDKVTQVLSAYTRAIPAIAAGSRHAGTFIALFMAVLNKDVPSEEEWNQQLAALAAGSKTLQDIAAADKE